VFAASLAALLVLERRTRGSLFWPLLALLLSSQAFVLFTSSGLETSLAYLILALSSRGPVRDHGPAAGAAADDQSGGLRAGSRGEAACPRATWSRSHGARTGSKARRSPPATRVFAW
jgi:hypothetical protein